MHETCGVIASGRHKVVLDVPVATSTRHRGIVGVVHIAKEHRPAVVREAQAKQLASIVTIRAQAAFHIHRPAKGVDLLQVDIHHQFLFFLIDRLDAEGHIPVGLLSIDLDGVHHIAWQIVQRNLGITLEEVAPVDHQVVHKLAIHEYLAILQLHARQAAHQAIEHAALCQLEGIGVIDDGVATVVHLDLRRLHHHLAKLVLAQRHGQLAQLEGTNDMGGLSVLDERQLHLMILRIIVLGRDLQHVISTREIVHVPPARVIRRSSHHLNGVGIIQHNLTAIYSLACKTVNNIAIRPVLTMRHQMAHRNEKHQQKAIHCQLLHRSILIIAWLKVSAAK